MATCQSYIESVLWLVTPLLFMGCLSNGSLSVQCNFSAYKFEPTEYIPFEQDFLHSKSLYIVCLPLLPSWMLSMGFLFIFSVYTHWCYMKLFGLF